MSRGGGRFWIGV